MSGRGVLSLTWRILAAPAPVCQRRSVSGRRTRRTSLVFWDVPCNPASPLHPSSRTRRGYASRTNAPPPLWEHPAPAGCLHTARPTTAVMRVCTHLNTGGRKSVAGKLKPAHGMDCKSFTQQLNPVKRLMRCIYVTPCNLWGCVKHSHSTELLLDETSYSAVPPTIT